MSDSSKFNFELDDLLDFHEENDDTGIPGPTAMSAILREHGKNEDGKLLKTTAAGEGYSELQFSTQNMGQLMMGIPIHKDQDTTQKQQNYLLSALLGDTLQREETEGKLGGNFDKFVPKDVRMLADTKIAARRAKEGGSGLYKDPTLGTGSSSSTDSDGVDHATGAGTTGNIFVVGDSLMVGSGPFLKQFLPGRNVEIDALIGRTTDAGFQVLKGKANLPQVVLINLGTNDSQVASYIDKIKAIMDFLGASRKVFWDSVWFGSPSSNHPDVINAAIRSAATTFSNLTLVDVGSAARGQGGHLDGAGYKAKGKIEADVLKTAVSSVSGTAGGPLVGGSNKEKIFNFFVANGFTKLAACGIIGNAMIESGCDPRAVSPLNYRGIFQWDKRDRWPRLLSWAGTRDPWALETQLAYTMYEISIGYGKVVPAINAASSAGAAATIWNHIFEGAPGQMEAGRSNEAEKAAREFIH